MTWDLRVGAKVVIPHAEAKNAGAVGVVEKKRDENYCIMFEETSKHGHVSRAGRLLGNWWIDEV